MVGLVQYYIYQMSSNSICLDSPFFKAPASFNYHSMRDVEIQLEESQHNRFIFASPEIIPPTFRLSHNLTPQSPWPFLANNDQICRPEQFSLPVLFQNETSREAGIGDRIIYSDSEEDDRMITPQRPKMSLIDEFQDAQLQTTGRKQSIQPLQISKPSRPKQRGLKVLSQRAYEIVQSLKNVTYNEVAQRLIAEVTQEDEQDKGNKDEQNIKRRAYDAINVLISSGLIKKDGRKITCDPRKWKKCGEKYDDIQDLRKKIKAKQVSNALKKKKLKQVQEKYQLIRFLITRNQKNTHHHKSIISFPFVGLNLADACAKTVQPSKTELIISTKNQIQPFGDIDSLKWLRESTQNDGTSLFL